MRMHPQRRFGLTFALASTIAMTLFNSLLATSCPAPWTGNGCEKLDIRPTQKGLGLNLPNQSTWGGSVIQGDDGKFHIMTNQCGLDSWQKNSECVHAVSDKPMGPYKIVQKVGGVFTHNPTIRKTHDGHYLLFTIGDSSPISQITDCSNGVTHSRPKIILQIGCLSYLRKSLHLALWPLEYSQKNITYHMPRVAAPYQPRTNCKPRRLYYYGLSCSQVFKHSMVSSPVRKTLCCQSRQMGWRL
ncbi:MAG: hypothetical protein GY750_14230 [Lentisphaerae bacterium]|nr:hypothetical protein [Lentisphaerota bacterium]MCP4102558.1 hypothetical protein [Lentisphaerota bacterium]